MFALLAAVVVFLAVVEIYVMVLVAQGIGALNMIGLLILCSLMGVWLAKREGFGVLARIRDRAAMRQPLTDDLVDGALVLLGGLLLIVPGFVSDAMGLLLLFPPTRAVARTWVKGRFRLRVYGVITPPYGSRAAPGNDDIIDV
jgi:UPF0716 protein FxsA